MSSSQFCFSWRWLALALVVPSFSCQNANNLGSSSRSSGPVVVQLNQSSVSLAPNAQQQFTAAVTGTSNTAVAWSVDATAGGNAASGTISSTGLYTAPSVAGTHTVTATSVADSTKSANATVTVTGTVTVTPGTSTIEIGQTQQFSASVQGETDQTVTWSVDGVSGGNATVGTITSAGLYTAPSQAGGHTITATTVATPVASATGAVSVYSFSLSPSSTSLLTPAGTQQFTATMQGLSNNGVSWTVDGVSGGNSTVGTIDSTGLYTAPNALGMHTIAATSVALPTATLSSQLTVLNSEASAVVTYHNDDARTGAYTGETVLNTSNVNSTQFGRLLTYPVDGQIYGQPLYLPQVNIPNVGTHPVVFVATQNNSVYAFQADATTPTTLWHVNLGAPLPVYDDGGPWPQVGILSTPVIDVTTNTLYVVADINGASPTLWLHALDVTTGQDKTSAVGVTATYQGDTFTYSCFQRMGVALSPVTNLLYLAIGSCENGWLLAYDKTTLAQKAIFEDTNGAAGGGFWSSGAAPAIDDTNGDVYLMSGVDSGDEQYITGSSMIGYNDSFLRLKGDDLSVLDYFAPDNNYTLAVNDVDLGSGGNILLPGSALYPHIVMGGGKDGNVFVVNRDSMGGFNNTSNNVLETVHIGTTQYSNIFSTPAYWNGSIYFHTNKDVLRAFSWNAGADAGQQLSSSSTSAGSVVFGTHGATVSVSANGATNGIVWEIDNSSYVGDNPSASGPCVLHAYDASNVATELYNSGQAGTRDQAGLALKFTVPTIVDGRVFVPTATELDVYGLLQ